MGVFSIFGDIFGGIETAKADRAQGKAQYQIGYQSAALSDMAGQSALERGSYEAGLARMRGSQVAGKQKTAYATSGVDSSSGTAAKTLLNTQMMADLDSQIISNNAARQAWGYKVQALQQREQGQLASISGNKNAQAAILTAGSRAMDDYTSMGMSSRSSGSVPGGGPASGYTGAQYYGGGY